MRRVYACIDACIDKRAATDAVIDWAAWAALRMALPLEFLHVLERHPEQADAADFSGTIGPDAQDKLLQTLSEEDARRSKVAREAGRLLLSEARARAAARGSLQLDVRLRHGDLAATVLELATDAALFVLGEHHSAGRQAHANDGHHLERVIRAVQQPVLVAHTGAFAEPRKIVLAFDGGANAQLTVRRLATLPWLAGLPVLVAMVGPANVAKQKQLEQARVALAAAGLAAEKVCLPGEAQRVLPELLRSQGPALLVMGAFGHSRLRQMVLGSTTSKLLRFSGMPTLILR
jgi:nucleotide-binding universal stress UspA family protein